MQGLHNPSDAVYGRVRFATLSLIDEGLFGYAGARTVLRNVTGHVRHLELSHNELGDDGLQLLCEGLSKLRNSGQHPGLLDLNLSSNQISDVGLHHLIKHLLLPSERPYSHPPTLVKLTLSANNIHLKPDSPVPYLLAAALSHPASRLRHLSLTGNYVHLSKFLAHCSPTSLLQLELNTCGLGSSSALHSWLADPTRGARLESLSLNGNFIGEHGVRRLSALVLTGVHLRLRQLELAANARTRRADDNEPISATDGSSGSESETSEEPQNVRLGRALGRNTKLKQATQHAAIAFIVRGRTLLLAQAGEPRPGHFPWARLPPELQIHILWFTTFCTVSFDLRDQALPRMRLGDPLSSSQFLALLKLCQDRRTILNPPRQPRSAPVDDKLALLEALGCDQWRRD